MSKREIITIVITYDTDEIRGENLLDFYVDPMLENIHILSDSIESDTCIDKVKEEDEDGS